jgi:hypothetical protein
MTHIVRLIMNVLNAIPARTRHAAGLKCGLSQFAPSRSFRLECAQPQGMPSAAATATARAVPALEPGTPKTKTRVSALKDE